MSTMAMTHDEEIAFEAMVKKAMMEMKAKDVAAKMLQNELKSTSRNEVEAPALEKAEAVLAKVEETLKTLKAEMDAEWRTIRRIQSIVNRGVTYELDALWLKSQEAEIVKKITQAEITLLKNDSDMQAKAQLTRLNEELKEIHRKCEEEAPKFKERGIAF